MRAREDKRLLRLLPVERWPTEDEARRSRWLSPVQIGPLEARERTWIPAMVPWRATDDGFVTEDVIGWYRRFAESAPGVIVVEATGIRDVPSGPLLRIGHDRFVPGLRRLTVTVIDAQHIEPLDGISAGDLSATVDVSATLEEALAAMLRDDKGMVGITDGAKFVGVLTPNGIHKALRASRAA